MLFSQENDLKIVDNAIQNLQAKWEDNAIFSIQGDSANTRLLHTLLSYKVDHSNKSNALESQLNLLKIDMHKRDIGLNGSAGYLENLDPAPDDDNLFYFRRIQAGLTWNILKDGFVSHKYRAKSLAAEYELSQKANSREKKKEDYLSRWHSIMFMFNQVKVDILSQRQLVLKTQLDYAREFYRLKLLKREELLAIEARVAETKAMLSIYESYNQQLSPDFPTVVSYSDNIPVFDLNMNILLSDFKALASDSIVNLSEDLLKYKTSIVHDIRLNAFLRYNWYDIVNTATGNRSFLSLGLNASFPIPFNQKIKKEIYRTEFELEKFQGETSLSETQKELLNDAYEYRYKLKQYVNFYEKRVRFMELLRQENVLLKLDPLDFNPVKALGLIDDILKIDIELTELNQNMYLKTLRIYSEIPYLRSRDLVKPFFMPNFDDKEDKIQRSFYLWSSGLRDYSPSFIEEYLKYNQADELVLSVNEDHDLDSLRTELINNLSAKKRPIHLMIGRNKLMTEGNINDHLNAITKNLNAENFSGIHLDIEPHTFDDYKSRKAEYLKKYEELINEASAWCKAQNKELSVSIPLHYPIELVNNLYTKVDKIYFMCYENVKAEYLIRKLNEFGHSEQTVIALRTDDFSNRLELERLFDEISIKTGIHALCMHDFSSVFEMDADILKGDNNEIEEEDE